MKIDLYRHILLHMGRVRGFKMKIRECTKLYDALCIELFTHQCNPAAHIFDATWIQKSQLSLKSFN